MYTFELKKIIVKDQCAFYCVQAAKVAPKVLENNGLPSYKA